MSSFNFVVSSRLLLNSAKLALPLVASNPVVPILENLLLTVEAGQLTLRSCDLQTTFTSAPLAVEAQGEGAICVPAKLLTQTLAALADQPLTITVDANTYGVAVKSARATYRLAGENPVDFPRPGRLSSVAQECQLLPSAWAEGLAATLPFTSNDPNRAAMLAVAIYGEAQAMRMVATDGFRVQMFCHALGVQEIGLPSSPTPYLLPPGAATLLAGLLKAAPAAAEPLRAVFTPDYCQLTLPTGELHCRLIEDRFPDYQNVVPLHNPFSLTADRDELLAALGRAALYANEKTRQVRLTLGQHPEEFAISAEDLDFSNETREAVSGSYEGEQMEIGFSAVFLRECLKALPTGRVSVSFASPNRAALLRAEAEPDSMAARVRCLLMPLMLNYTPA